MHSVKIGMCQIHVANADPEGNLQRASDAVALAASQGAQIVVLPETLDLGWIDASARTQAEPIPGPRTDYFAGLARKHGVYLACGLTESGKADEKGVVYNAAILLGPDGSLLLHHRKVNEVRCARNLYTTGTSVGVVNTELGKIGLNICADNFAESAALGQAQGIMGAALIVSPSTWALDPEIASAEDPEGVQWIQKTWVEPYQRLAQEFTMAIVGVSNVGGRIGSGELEGRVGIGGSLAVGSDGTVITGLPYGQSAVAVQTVDVALRS